MSITIEYAGRRHPVAPGETVLQTLLKAGEKIESSCGAGVCQSCLVRAESGKVPAAAQQGLRESLKSTGCFLACLCKPEEDLAVAPAQDAASFRGTAAIRRIDHLGADVACVTFERPPGLEFRAGQFIALTREDRGAGLTRSYSIASLPSREDAFEIHVRKIRDGRMSGWFHDNARAGDRLAIAGPRGDCFYSEGMSGQPITLIGTGTGMAPLLAIVRDALAKGHQGDIHVYDGALEASGLYLLDTFDDLARKHPQIRYTPCVLREGAELSQVVLERAAELKAGTFFLCGDPVLVQSLKKKLFLSGASLKRIFADPFVAATSNP